ncbi:dTDP-glucose 4,6-dehydratase [Candidatus Poribacteria bacterium]|nr:dTDP-glucose 4,6-dehydratase [Candidatus Poribacteria bacterium]
MKNLMVTGGAGFIGAHFVRLMLTKYDYHLVNFDALTYSGNLDNLRDVEAHPRYQFIQGNICDMVCVEKVVREYAIDTIVNFAAETHVDRSLLQPGSFIQTDVYGTYVLLDVAKKHQLEKVVLVSTDEIYGSVEAGSSIETDSYAPNSPYSASKAGGELMARAYHITYGIPVLITRGSNNIGPNQYPEKVVPLFITNALQELPLPIYGSGLNVRNYIYVTDHCNGIDVAMHKGIPGEIYNVGAGAANERNVLEVAGTILRLTRKPKSLIQHVSDRPGHDKRYSLDSTKLRSLGWEPQFDFDSALEMTVKWYIENEGWWHKIREKDQAYRKFYVQNYEQRETK